MQLASYLEGGPLMWMMPLHLQVNQKSDYDIYESYQDYQLSLHTVSGQAFPKQITSTKCIHTFLSIN